MKIKLKRERRHWRFSHREVRDWKTCEPFIVNYRGSLIHRVRFARSYLNSNGTVSHRSVTYWCGNYCRIENDNLFTDPPQDRLLCAACEAKAVAAGEKPASELAGRHVHTGRLVPVRVCCKQNKN